MKLSKLIGMSQSAINRYELGETAIPDSALLKYADFFDVSADYILGRTDKPEGKLYKYEPKVLHQYLAREDEWTDFVEACFDPRSPMYNKLKEMMINMSDTIE